MPLRDRILGEPETIAVMEQACEQRYWEGVELLLWGRSAAGAYLLGYVAEIVLKCAWFRFDGGAPTSLVPPRLGPVRTWARSALPAIAPEGYHSVWFWANVLRVGRRQAGRPLPRLLEAQLMQRAHRIHGVWTVQIRYHPDQTSPHEVESIYDDVTWLWSHRVTMRA